MILYNRFFISFNNMNFYIYIQDQCFYNKKHSLNYIADYIFLINININRQNLNKNVKSFNRSEKQYLAIKNSAI